MVRGLSEFGITEVRLTDAPRRELTFWIRSKEAPDVEVFDAVLAVNIVLRGSLAERDRKQSAPVEATCLGTPLEEALPINRCNLRETA